MGGVAPPRVRALVLAAGRGERLRPLTEELPKPLLPVAGRPLAAWTLERLRRAGVDAAALNLHHRGERIRAAFGESFRGLPLVYSEEPELLGTGGALPPLRDFFAAADVALLVNGDSLCRWPLERLLARHRRDRRRGVAATLLVHRTVDPRAFGGGVALEGERLVAFRRGAIAWSAARTKRVFAGAAALDPALLARLPAGPSDIVSTLYEPLLAAGGEIATVATARAWHDLGTPARYLEGALAWALERLPPRGTRILPGAAVDPTARLARVVVESDATIGAGARLADSLLLPGACVEAGATLRGAILGPGATVGAGETVVGLLRAVVDGRSVERAIER